jgi:hypothetical protein
MAFISTKFDPLVHGFKFVNRFDFPDLFKSTLTFFPHKGIGDILYGLCGGMCFAAIDYFQAGKPVIPEKNEELIPLYLFEFLWERQTDTLTWPVIERLVAWSIYSSTQMAKLMAKDEIPAVMKSIDAGSPCVLLVMRSQGFQLTQNHQVVATAYELNPDTKDLAIQLYDPNHPGETPCLTMSLAKPGQVTRLSQSTSEPLRGFFKLDYVRADPV